MLDGIVWDEARSRVTVHTVTGPEHLVDVDRLEVEVKITDQVDRQFRVRSGRLSGIDSQQPWK